MSTQKRSQETMRTQFTLRVDDVYTVKQTAGLSNTVCVNVDNEQTDEHFVLTFVNNIETWKSLKRISEIRPVFVEQENDLVPYRESRPYKARCLQHAK